MSIKKVGVLGAGVIGIGVAQSLAQNGFSVILIDLDEKILQHAMKSISEKSRLHGLFTKERNEVPTPETILQRIQTSTNYNALSDVEVVIENVTEKWSIKESVYSRLDSICSPECIFASNTSAIPITQIAALTHRPAQVVGIHFMNPVPLKSVVEVIRGFHTSEETIQAIKELLAGMKKDGIVVNDGPGFVSNRVMMLMINEAIFLLQDQVAPPEDIDKIFKQCFGHKMGPLETADLIGLDTILYTLEVLVEQFNDSKYRPCPLLRKKVNAGQLGEKTGQGFYSHYHV